MKSLFIDSHAHLDSERYNEDLDRTVERAIEAGVAAIITIGTDLESSLKSVEIAERFSLIYASVGVHPHEAGHYSDQVEKDLERLLTKNKVVAVGETGLDYYYDHSPRPVQKTVFAKQLDLAEKHSLPVIIHCRDATDDLIGILEKKKPAKAVLHCFSGERNLLDFALESDYYISVAGTVSFKKAGDLRQAVSRIPRNRLLIETDSPYLAPVPFRGKRNEPAWVKNVAETVAPLLGFTPEDIGRIASRNLERLFRIDLEKPQGEIAYRIRNSLYLNLTNRCTNACGFCARNKEYFVSGHHLRLDREPTFEKVQRSLENIPEDIEEIVFCGFGEPLLRPELVESAASWVKERTALKVRINTNGNLENPLEILQRLKGKTDVISVSLNAENEELYKKLCQPLKPEAYQNVLRFIAVAVEVVPEVIVTALEGSGADMELCRQLAEKMGAAFRLRKMNVVG